VVELSVAQTAIEKTRPHAHWKEWYGLLKYIYNQSISTFNFQRVI